MYISSVMMFYRLLSNGEAKCRGSVSWSCQTASCLVSFTHCSDLNVRNHMYMRGDVLIPKLIVIFERKFG